MQNDAGHVQSAAPATKNCNYLQLILRNRRKSIAPATQNDFWHVTKHVWMSRSATPTTRNEATRRLKPPKMTPSAELTIGTAIRGSRERLRTVANGCERLGNVERTHPQPPDPQSETGTLATHSGKRKKNQILLNPGNTLKIPAWRLKLETQIMQLSSGIGMKSYE